MRERRVAWALGKDLFGAKTVEQALDMAEANFTVDKQKIYLEGGIEIPNQFANVRSDNGDVLGIVTDQYKIVQNLDAFAFVDSLVPEGLEFEKGGVFKFGRSVWVEGKLPKTYNILGDDIDAHLVFRNSHDGSCAVKVAIIPNRLACSNQLNAAFKKAQRTWSAQHCTNVDKRLVEAQHTLGLADAYMETFRKEIENLANKKMTIDQFNRDILDKIYPITDDTTDSRRATITEIKTGIMECYDAPDIANFKGTAYGAMLATTDYFDHREPLRRTTSFEERRLEKIIDGHPDIDRIVGAVMSA